MATAGGRAPALRWLLSHRGVFLALLVTAAALAAQPRPQPLRYQSLDAWAYVAIANDPTVFTARPWGYRVLTPWLVHMLREPFVHVTRAALTLAAVLLFLFLRRLGHGEIPSLVAVAAFGLSGPVRESLVDPYLCEPVSVLLETAFLLAAQSGAGLGVLSLLGVMASLSKEILLVLLPLVYFSRRERVGSRRALTDAAVVAVPAILVTLLMRFWWTPHIRTPYPLPGRDTLAMALERLGPSWWATGILLGGLTPLAALGALQPRARPFLRGYGYLVVSLLVLPFLAWTYDPRPDRVPFFSGTVKRLLIYALPVLLPLCLVAVDRVLPHLRLPAPHRRPRELLEATAALAAMALATLPVWGMDRYRRIEIRGHFDGPMMLALCRESLGAAARLEEGGTVSFDPDEHRFSSDKPLVSKPRWFLRDGWETSSYYGSGEVVTEGRTASVLLPCYRPRDLALTLSLSARGPSAVSVEVNGWLLKVLAVGPGVRDHALHVPAAALFRGDNTLGFTTPDQEDPGVRLHGLLVRVVGGR